MSAKCQKRTFIDRNNRAAKRGGPKITAAVTVLEFVVHTEQNILKVRFGAESMGCARTARDADLRGITIGAEAHEIVFEKHRPVRYEHPFDTATNRPPRPVAARDFANLRTGRVESSDIP